ncbi:MAG: PD40 domain-containing protein [Gammaproteobacteria bacterium]|nr:PD40 domain-containing protein [Gammaproteobacteria bacterium]
MLYRLARRSISVGSIFASLLALASTAEAQPPSAWELAIVDLEGRKQVVGTLPPSAFAPRVSPDGTRVVFETRPESPEGEGARLWIADLYDLGSRRSLPIVGAPYNWAGMWTKDGERIVYLAAGERPDAIFWQSVDGSGDAEHLIDGRSAESWAGGGSQMTFLTLVPEGDYGISMLDVESGDTTVLIDVPGSAQHSSSVSPDGRWIAYASNETGRYEVWLAPVARPDARRRITRQGGAHPLWSPDGETLYFDRENRMYRVDVRIDHEVSIGEPLELPIAGFQQGEYRRQFDLMPDGSAFLLIYPLQQGAPR